MINFLELQKIILIAFLIVMTGCANTNNTKFLENLEIYKIPNTKEKEEHIVAINYNEKSNHLAVGLESGEIEILDGNRINSRLRVNAHELRANLITFTTNGDSFFSSSYFSDTTKLWDTKTGKLIHSIENLNGPISPTQHKDIYIIANSSELYFFDYEKKFLFPEKYIIGGVVQSIDFNKNNILIGTASGTIEIWEISYEKNIPKLIKLNSIQPYRMGEWVVGVAFSADGKKLYSVSKSGKIDEWATDNLEKIQSIPSGFTHILSTTFDPKNNLIGIGGEVDSNSTYYENPKKGNFSAVISLTSKELIQKHRCLNQPFVKFIKSDDWLISGETNLIRSYNLKN